MACVIPQKVTSLHMANQSQNFSVVIKIKVCPAKLENFYFQSCWFVVSSFIFDIQKLTIPRGYGHRPTALGVEGKKLVIIKDLVKCVRDVFSRPKL